MDFRTTLPANAEATEVVQPGQGPFDDPPVDATYRHCATLIGRLNLFVLEGSIEQDADIVLMLHRPDENEREALELIVAKHRHGDTGTLDLRFVPNETRFGDAAEGFTWAP